MPFPSNGQNFVRPQSGGTGSWMAKLFGGIADDRRSRTEAQIQFDLHEAKANVDTEHKIKRAVGEESAKAFGKIETAKGVSKVGLKTFGKYTAPKEEYVDKKGNKRTRGGMGLNVEDIAGFDQNYMPRFQATGLERRNRNKGAAPVNSDVNDGGNPPTPPSGGNTPSNGGKASKPRKNNTKAAAKPIASTNPVNPKNNTETPSNNSGAPTVTPPKTRKPRTPKAGA